MNGRFERSLVLQCKALSDIWTGGIDQLVPLRDYQMWCDEQRAKNNLPLQQPNSPPRQLHLTSILGGIRWWAEAIVRSFGGHACDPTARDAPNAVCGDKNNLCLICKLFGNPNVPQAAKFALRCWNSQEGNSPRTEALKKGDEFQLEFLFYKCEKPERNPNAYEIWLLAKTLDLIASYGSIGGKTVFKPTSHIAPTPAHILLWEERAKAKAGRRGRTATNRDIQEALVTETDAWKFRHSDFGIIEIDHVALPKIPGVDWQAQVPCHEMLEQKIPQTNGVLPIEALPNFDNFWFVNDFRLQIHPPNPPDPKTGSFNDIIGVEDRPLPQNPPVIRYFRDGLDSIRAHLRGTLAEKSKRVFSFRNPARTWGFVIPNEYVCINVPASTVTEEPTCKVAVQKVLDSVNPSAGRSVLWGDALKVQPLSFSVL